MRLVFSLLLSYSLLFSVDKYQNQNKSAKPQIQITIKNIASFDFQEIEHEYHLELQHCLGYNICIFKPINEIDIYQTIYELKKFGKVRLYRPYRLKTY